MKARRHRDLMFAFTLLFDEFVGAGASPPQPPLDPNGSAQTDDDPPPLTTPLTKHGATAKANRRSARSAT